MKKTECALRKIPHLKIDANLFTVFFIIAVDVIFVCLSFYSILFHFGFSSSNLLLFYYSIFDDEEACT